LKNVEQQKSKKRKRKGQGRPNLRALYNQDPEARAFLSAHPEFNGFQAEQYQGLTEYMPPFNEARETEYQEIMAHLHKYPEPKVRELLEAYYEEGRSISALTQITGLSKLNTASEIMRAKRRVLAYIRSGRVDLESVPVLGHRRLLHKGRESLLKLVVWNGVPTWVTETGTILDDELQAHLKGELK
jgi:hypothetical protein